MLFMCNSGNKRNELAHSSQKLSGAIVQNNPVKTWSDTNFEYTGQTGLTITGNVTGKRYRFNRPGDIQVIDYRDVSGMLGVPVLKKV